MRLCRSPARLTRRYDAVHGMMWSNDNLNETAITHRVVAGQTAYLAVAPRFACASVDPVPESEARKLLSRTIFRPL